MFSSLFLGERVTAMQIAGDMLILGGTLFYEIKFVKKSSKKKYTAVLIG